MRKILSCLVVLATAGLILAGALLPQIIGNLLNGGGDGVQYADMQSVRLDIGADLTLIGKLALMREGEALDLNESQASSTPEKIEAIAWQTLGHYQDAGLIDYFDEAIIQVRPTMSVDPADPGCYTVTWAVIISTSTGPSHLVMMTIDDETGVVLSISYDTALDWFPESGEADAATALWEIFFSGLGLEPTPIQGSGTGYDLLALLYDETCGYVQISFYIFASGFFIEFT